MEYIPSQYRHTMFRVTVDYRTMTLINFHHLWTNHPELVVKYYLIRFDKLICIPYLYILSHYRGTLTSQLDTLAMLLL